MDMNNTGSRALAITAGLAFTGGGLCILLGDAIATPSAWTIYHALTILTVFGTIAAGHLMTQARRANHWFAAAGFALLFLAGTALVVYSSVGRQAEVSDTKTLAVEAANAEIAAKQAELAKARQRLDDANRYSDKEMTGERCGQRCKDWRLRATEVTAHVRQIEAEIAALGPQKPVNPEAAQMAKLAALFGADEEQATAMLTLVKPFLWTLFFEVGSIVSMGFAFRPFAGGRLRASGVARDHQNDNALSASDTMQTSFPVASDPDRSDFPKGSGGVGDPNGSPKAPKGSPRGVLRPKRSEKKEAVLAALVTDVGLGRAFGKQVELTERFGVPASTLSEWLKEWEAEGLLPKRTLRGRCKTFA